MSIQLLDKTRKINKLLHNNSSSKLVFSDVCNVLCEVLLSNILVISRNGKVLGIGENDSSNIINNLLTDKIGDYIDKELNERLLNILSTKENVNLVTLGFDDKEQNIRKYRAIITPIDIAGERLGTLFIYRLEKEYDIDDIILAEYGNTVVGLEMIRSVSEENEQTLRKNKIVELAVGSLSYSEKRGIKYVMEEISGNEGTIVASKVADKALITRSVIVNGIRKLESAGVIETHSNGMKGTHIVIKNNLINDAIKTMEI